MAFSGTEDILAFVSGAIPGFLPAGKIEELSGGNLNRVWRVSGSEYSLVVKHAPPYVAKAPDIPLDPRRIILEAAALRLFDKPPLNSIVSERLRPPRLLHADENRHAIILEDLGNLDSLDEAENIGEDTGTRLGAFLARLHGLTAGDEAIAASINNRGIQQSRLDVQYARVGEMLGNYGIPNSAELGGKARKLGEKYLAKGRCLIMGDLWPRSILIAPRSQQARVIDWEFAHYGRPAQDVAHLLAHLWMLQHRAGTEDRKNQLRQFATAFTKSYRREMRSHALLFDEEERADAGVHFGAEILARTLGSFRDGYVYEGLGPGHPAMQEAVEKAVRALGPEFGVFDGGTFLSGG
ncbi:MAG: phosphotransferase [Phaeodactylibacter sp.]|nr:phosphotransferase [Phaeodactylibacter sp.]